MLLNQKIKVSTDWILSKVPQELRKPQVGIICGSGLGQLAESKDSGRPCVSLAYCDIPNFCNSTVAGHQGSLDFFFLNGKPVVCMIGRLHTYEGHEVTDTVFPIHVMCSLKVQVLFITNAAGAINETYDTGDLMVVSDHINLPGMAGLHPLKGPNDDSLGPRFLPMTQAYDFQMRVKFFKVLQRLKISRKVHEGVYAFVSGPSYETRAEVRAMATLGIDTIGMSTVSEVIVAQYHQTPVLAVSLVTNKCIPGVPPSARDPKYADWDGKDGEPNHCDVVCAAQEAAEDLKALMMAWIAEL